MAVSQSTTAKLTVIIVNWNGDGLLLRCLQSLRSSVTTFPVKGIVVDNASTDGSREAVQREFPEFLLLNTGANLGYGKGNNYARPWVDTPYVLILNPDTELQPDTLETTVRFLERHPDIGLLGCKMVDPDGTVQEQGIQWFPNPLTIFIELSLGKFLWHPWCRRWLPILNPHISQEARKLYGGFLLSRREVLDEAGWFDPRYFMYAEDADLSRTVRRLGWKLYYLAEAEIVHTCGGTSEQAPAGFSILMKQHSLNQLIRKYQGPWSAALHRVMVAVAALGRLGGQVPFALARAVGLFRTGDRHQAWRKSVMWLKWALRVECPKAPAWIGSPPGIKPCSSPTERDRGG